MPILLVSPIHNTGEGLHVPIDKHRYHRCDGYACGITKPLLNNSASTLYPRLDYSIRYLMIISTSLVVGYEFKPYCDALLFSYCTVSMCEHDLCTLLGDDRT